MADLCGSGYVIDHCISALIVEREEKRDRTVLNNYVTDCLKIITENTARSAMSGGSYISNRYAEIVDPAPKEPDKSAEDIVRDVFTRAGLQIKREEVKEEDVTGV